MVPCCRLQEEDGTVEVSCLRLLPPMSLKFTVGAVAGDRLYLTSFLPPNLGKLLSVDFTKDADPEVRSAHSTLCVIGDTQY